MRQVRVGRDEIERDTGQCDLAKKFLDPL
jgi:hypothetical protein